MFEANLGGVSRLYRAALARCWFPALLLALCWGAAATLLNRRLPATDDFFLWAAQAQALMWSGYFWRLLVVTAVLSVLFYCAIVAEIYAAAMRGGGPALAGFAPALRVLPGALVAATVFLVVTSLATMLFVVPGAFLWGMWQLWLVVLVVERTGPIASLQRSWQLMTGAWWRITTLVTIVTFIAMVPPLILDAVFGSFLAFSGVDLARATGIMTVAGGLLNALLVPLVPAALVAAYLDRLRSQVVLP